MLGAKSTCIYWTTTLFLSTLLFVATVPHEQRIETLLTARWPETHVLAEAAEYISELDSSLYWNFLENIFEKQEAFLGIPIDDESFQDLATVSAFNLISPGKLRMLEWALTSRAFSPKVHMLQELAPQSIIPANCDAFVQYGKTRLTCSLEDLKRLISLDLQPDVENSVTTTEADHKFPSFVWNDQNPTVLILYGNLMAPATRVFHEYLKSQAGKYGYVFRPFHRSSGGSLALSGYGAELQFKSTEYVAQDDSGKNSEKEKSEEVDGFLFDKLHAHHPELSQKLESFQNHLTSARGKKSEFTALKAWQVQELGLQASYYTTLQDNLLDALIDISGNFPSRAAALSAIRVPSDFKKAVSYNQQILQSHFNLDEGEGAFFIQGNFVDPDSLDLFTFMETLQTELDLMESLRSIYHETPQTRAQIDHFLSMGSKSSTDPELALDMRDSSIYWINDLEKDEEYEDWPEDLTQLFYRMGGVMLRPVRRNVFNLMLTLNPDDATVTENMLRLAQSFMAHKAPLRIGVVFCSDSNVEDSNSIEESKGDIIRRVFNYALSENKIKKAFNLLVEAYSNNDFGSILKRFGNPGDEYDFGAQAACEYIKKGGRPTPGAFLNGIPLKWDSVDDFEEIVLNQLLREAQSIQIDAYHGKVGDSTDIFAYIMNKPSIQTRLNDKILDTSNAKYVSFGNEMWEPGKALMNPVASLAASLSYLSPTGGKRKSPVSTSLWVLADISTHHGHKFLQNSLEYLQESSTHSRIAFIPTDQKSSIFKTMVQQAFAENDLKKALSVLREHSDEGGEETTDSGDRDAFLRIIGIPVGGNGLVVNGRVIGPLSADEIFDLGDWALVEKFSHDSCGKYFEEAEGSGDTPMRLCAEFGNPKIKAKNLKRLTMPEFQLPSSPESKNNNSDPYYLDIRAVIDPASRHANKMATLLSAVQDKISRWVRIHIIFNPPSKHSELPLKSYFRYIAGTKRREIITFSDIPRDPLFTQGLIAPDNWMVEVVKGLNDFDNIKLKDLPGSIYSEFELANLLVEGHCLELKSGSPPRGVQFNLKSLSEGTKEAETIVMANLGYFQLKAQPGVWQLELREGPSNEIFALESQNTKPIVVKSFQSVVVKVKVKRNPGKETASLLDSEEESGGSWFNFGNKNLESEDDTINVFSLASGHLYERLLKIMMLSVMKTTKSKVKFWFLKNYLSPLIKDELPLLAKEYGFEYELVQYHWPRWLNPQREKQRIIWGYKILFLDVLFPLSLKKIVYVDADQVVQSDLKELFDLDLEGNPYGYTPFCDSRTDMDGFRFWKSGYWRSHLGKRKYHISALYVVDLVRFRRVAAGDRLRGQYQALSQDPNSLSNLDQDLPNNMIHQVGIFSLPQEWLWCETWCHDSTKKSAKTIDLCNNPMTKESKLDAAQRIIPEWKGYDQEIRDFQERIRKNVTPTPNPTQEEEEPKHEERDEL